MNDFIGIDIVGLEEVLQGLEKLPIEAADNGVESANNYMLEVLKQYARSHRGEPFKWSSPAQRRAAMAKMRAQGGPPYRRTQALRKGWHLLGNGRNQIIVNEIPYAKFVKDPPIEGHRLREWTSIEEDAKKSMTKLLQRFEEGVRKAIKKLGL